MTETTNGAYYRAPTLAERFWRKLGFRYNLGDDPEGTDGLTGWMQTESYFEFGWYPRLLLLLTGRLKVVTTCHFDTPSPKVVKTRLDWMMYWPGQPR